MTRRLTLEERVERALRVLVTPAGQLATYTAGAKPYLPHWEEPMKASRRGTARAVERARVLLMEVDIARKLEAVDKATTPAPAPADKGAV